MAETRWKGEPGSVEAVRECLGALRESGGVAYADDDVFRPLLVMYNPAETELSKASRNTLSSVVLTHLRRTAAVATHESRADACTHAAAASLATIMERSAADSRKIQTIRRAASEQHGCHLTLDGLRKREDLLLDRVAKSVHADLVARARDRGPQTVEEAARLIIDDVREAFDEIDDVLKRVNPHAPMLGEISLNSHVLAMLYSVALMQYWCGRIIGIRMRVQQHSRADLLFAEMAQAVMIVAFPDYDDKSYVNALLNEVGYRNKRDFLERIVDEDGSQEVFARFRDWAQSCHRECAYQRTYNWGLLCKPHQVAFSLFTFIEAYNDLVTGVLEDDLATEFGAYEPVYQRPNPT